VATGKKIAVLCVSTAAAVKTITPIQARSVAMAWIGSKRRWVGAVTQAVLSRKSCV
jgi:hypothetical protein